MNTAFASRAGVAILTVTWVSSFVMPFMGSAMNVALPAIGAEFSMGAVALTWVNQAFLLASAMVLLPMGRLADLRGRRRAYIAGTWAFTLFSVLGALTPSGGWFLASRVLQGISAAMVFSTVPALLASAFPAAQRGRVLGINVTGVYLGLTLGPVLGGVLVQTLGWRSLLWLNLPLGMLILPLAYRNLPPDEARPAARLDLGGAALFSLGLGLLVVGFTRVSEPAGQAMTVASLACLTAFWRWERRVAEPMLDVRVFAANRLFLFSNLAALINYASTSAVVFLLSLYLQYIQGLTPAAAGGILLVQPLIMAALSSYAGALSDRVSPRLLASVGMGITATGLAAVGGLGPATPLPAVVAALVLLGLGFGLFSSPNTNAVMGSVARPHLGIASAALGTMRSTGQVLSMGCAALVLHLVMADAPLEPANYPRLLLSLRVLAAIFACLCLAGVFVSLARGGRAAGAGDE